MPSCQECADGRWECGSGELCGGGGPGWVSQGIVNIPVGIGRLTVPVEVFLKNERGECRVMLDPQCPKKKCDPTR